MLDVNNIVIKIIYKNKIIINYYIKNVLNTYLKNQNSNWWRFELFTFRIRWERESDKRNRD